MDAALVRCTDFEREFSKLDTDAQTILLLAFREHQPQRVICQIARCSERALAYKVPAALAALIARKQPKQRESIFVTHRVAIT